MNAKKYTKDLPKKKAALWKTPAIHMLIEQIWSESSLKL